MPELTFSAPLANGDTYRITGVEERLCYDCPFYQTVPPVEHRPFGLTGHNGERIRRTKREQIADAHNNRKAPYIRCTGERLGTAIITTNQSEGISTQLPCLDNGNGNGHNGNGHNGNGNGSADAYRQYASQLTGESRTTASTDQIREVLRRNGNREP